MVRCFPWALDFGQSNNTFYGISTFFEYSFYLANGGKSTDQTELSFSYISPLKSLNLILIPGAKLDGHGCTWTGCLLS